MKFVHYLNKIQHVSAYALGAFGIFAFVFIAALIYVVRTDKKTFQDLSNMPLD